MELISWVKLLIRQEKVCLDFIISCDPIHFLLILSPLFRQRIEAFLGLRWEKDPFYPASEHILIQGKGVKLAMNYTLNESNPFEVHSNLNASN